MKTPLDDARLRLSAVHPEMSPSERDRAVAKIADALTPTLLAEIRADLHIRRQRAEKDLAHIKLQLEFLALAQLRAERIL
jgi:hypothetical protein